MSPAGGGDITPAAEGRRPLSPPPDSAPVDDPVARARAERDARPIEEQQASLERTIETINRLSRSTFRKVLAELVEGAPTIEAVKRFADKYPDRWAQAVSIMGGLAGYERGVVEINVYNVQGLSDADLMRRLEDVTKGLREAGAVKLPSGDVVDVTPIPRGSDAAGDI